MSLAIDVDTVTHVLLADGWHPVLGDSFHTDAYEYVWQGEMVAHGDGQTVPHTGAGWTETNGVDILCPLNAILAVRAKASKKK
jgi:hypothetical protein